ncbi:MAG: DUF2147 domain-containing protein [Hyphomicrobiaceae bacterium]|nr:DUF2147 domain-containing protein [Hyphomicrobiaceae bacterium]
MTNFSYPSVRLSKAKPRRTSIRGLAAVALAGSAALIAGSATAQGPNELGRWYDDTGQGVVELYQCGSKLCGRIVWLRDPLGKDGKPLFDGYNPNPSMRSRTICGLQVLGDLARQSDGSLDGGWVYDPKVGKSYDAAMELENRNRLTLTGYKGVRFLGKSFTWTRAPANLPTCSSPTLTSSPPVR